MSEQEDTWHKPAAHPVLVAGMPQLWRVRLDRETAAPELKRLLAPDEVARMNQYRDERDRNRYAICRGALRQLLGRYLGVSGEHISIGYAPHGKPQIENPSEHPVLNFNISHSGGLALMAFSLDRQVGIDLEQIRPDVDFAAVARVFLSPSELASFCLQSGEDKIDAFYRYWVCKEAYLKARGTGLTLSPRTFSVSISGESPSITHADSCDRNESWSFSWVDVAAGFRAVFVCGVGMPVGYDRYDFS